MATLPTKTQNKLFDRIKKEDRRAFSELLFNRLKSQNKKDSLAFEKFQKKDVSIEFWCFQMF